jgi:hypothetical protein
MKDRQDKTLKEKRREAQRALEGEERRKKREEEEQIKREEERKKREEIERLKQEEERKRREKEERELKEKQKAKIKEEQRKIEEEKQKRKREEKSARQEALLKKIHSHVKPIAPSKVSPVLPRKPVKKNIKRVPPKSGKLKINSKLPSIRTYKSDVAEAVKYQKKSLAQIALAEKKRMREREKTTKERKPLPRKRVNIATFFITIGLIIVFTSGGTFLYHLNKTSLLSKLSFKIPTIKIPKKEHSNKTVILVKPLISSETEKGFSLQEMNDIEILNAIQDEVRNTENKNGIKNIYFTDIVSVEEEGVVKQTKTVAGVDKFLSVWKHNMPGILSRSLNNEFMIGIYSITKGGNVPFLVFTTNSYEQTFAGMFKWESFLMNDFYSLFGGETLENFETKFHDKIIDGKDTRVLTGTDNETIFLYSFVDKNTVVITTNEETFGKIIKRF